MQQIDNVCFGVHTLHEIQSISCLLIMSTISAIQIQLSCWLADETGYCKILWLGSAILPVGKKPVISFVNRKWPAYQILTLKYTFVCACVCVCYWSQRPDNISTIFVQIWSWVSSHSSRLKSGLAWLKRTDWKCCQDGCQLEVLYQKDFVGFIHCH